VRFTPGQLRHLLSLPPETFRHWKRALPPLATKNGYTPCFSLGDLLAVALIRLLINEAGLRISALVEVSASLFDICNTHSWAQLERTVILYETTSRRLSVAGSPTQTFRPTQTRLVLVCRDTIQALRARLLADEKGEDQAHLLFPPVSVTGGRRRS
jgi:hypothetical protein